jgi:hypothetical protein
LLTGAPAHEDIEDRNDEYGDDFILTEENDCFRIISDADPLDDATWNRRKQGNFAFMDQDSYDDLRMLVDDADVHEKEYSLDWVEEGEVPDPTDKMNDTPGCLRICRKKNVRAHIASTMSTLPLLCLNICIEESNNFAHQEMDKAKEKYNHENVICGTKWRHAINLGKFMVFIGILLHMCMFPLPGHSYLLSWSYDAITYSFVNKMQLQRFQQIRNMLHFNDNYMTADTNDALHKLPPILTLSKSLFGHSLEVSNEDRG